ncbi:SDR family NAD(P)-dependent oxidoreductase [Mesorhizobium sp. LHD-90]|uniref:SDR family NAD(P)-dependent oxidoreductase n=1 Tax=Mesorhizobium sp. LHD-90 TaxID=3071414 RepID=UPI0027DEE271|nr:SDR family NAD(P)-dependent oxidoreductase [Mesorhizobium sp. LHD-90]MDQ6435845.1 SDR family NAD(P)-dependent oxidoreductase [Mesorhizobium sp. LHD-90]
MNDAKPLDGKVAIVTGAAGGVGRATVELLTRRGASVVAEDVDANVAQLEAPNVAAVSGDVRKAETARKAVETALSRFGRLDILVNNAAVIITKDILSTGEDEWNDLMAVNVTGVFHHCRAVLPEMIRQKSGSIVSVSSISGLVGLPLQAAYCASKGAIVQLTRQLAVDYAEHGVRVNSVAPGSIDTPFLTRYLDSQPDPVAAERAIKAAHPIGRIGSPQEIAEAIASSPPTPRPSSPARSCRQTAATWRDDCGQPVRLVLRSRRHGLDRRKGRLDADQPRRSRLRTILRQRLTQTSAFRCRAGCPPALGNGADGA